MSEYENKTFVGDCKDVLKNIKDNSVDSMITDPPYGYSFMGKDWDKVVVKVENWKECFRVLKPGGFAFIMSAPRQDVLSRMIVNLQNAGFETGFTSIYWTYACLSEDTEVLTKQGWERFNNSNNFINKEILCCDVEKERYFYEVPSKWNYYQIQDSCYRIKSDFTDQIVTRNHRVVVEQEGKLLFQFAETLGQTISVPYLENLSMLQENISNLSCMVEKETNSRYVLLNQLQTESKHQKISTSIQQNSQNRWTSLDRRKKTKTKRINDWLQKSFLERWSDLLQNTWELYRSKIYSLSEEISFNGKKRWIRNGTPFINSKTNRQTFIKSRSSSSYRSQSYKQLIRELITIQKQPRTQIIRTWKPYRTTLATVTKIDYKGLVFCPTVSTGCFVVRRNGKIFLTGNSGFPKAMNISKAVDKRGGSSMSAFSKMIKKRREELGLSQNDIAKHFPSKTGGITGCVWNWEQGTNMPTVEEYNKLRQVLKLDELPELEEAEREIIAKLPMTIGIGGNSERHGLEKIIDKPASPQAKALDGSFAGFQPKPAVEVIIVAMKPLAEKNYVEQAMKNGKGVTWFDNCRIPGAWNRSTTHITDIRKNNYMTPKGLIEKEPQSSDSRFPANLLVSDNILNDGNVTISRPDYRNEENKSTGFVENQTYRPGWKRSPNMVNDSGSFSRYFDLDKWAEERLPKQVNQVYPFLIIPKASSSEKNKGLNEVEGKQVNDGRNIPPDNPFQRGSSIRKNTHPTVKPIKLMAYLVTLGTRENDIILDPFCGSGTTLIAAKILNRKYMGIDLDKEHIDLANLRLQSWNEKDKDKFINKVEQPKVKERIKEEIKVENKVINKGSGLESYF